MAKTKKKPKTGAEAWIAAGIPKDQIETWFEDKIEEIRECAKDLAHEEADNMTPEQFLEEYASRYDDGEE